MSTYTKMSRRGFVRGRFCPTLVKKYFKIKLISKKKSADDKANHENLVSRQKVNLLEKPLAPLAYKIRCSDILATGVSA